MAGRDDPGAMQQFIDTRGVSGFTHVFDEAGDIWTALDVRGQPFFIFIDDDGSIVDRTGALGADGLSERIDQLIAA